MRIARLVTAYSGHHYAGLGIYEQVHGRLERRPVCVDQILAEASNFASGGHFHSEEGVGAGQTSPGELRYLGGNVRAGNRHQVRGCRDILAYKRLRRNVHEVGTENLADEWERPGCPEVAFDDAQLGLSAGVIGLNDLHVERSGDIPRLCNLLGNDLDAVHDFLVEVHGR